MGACTTLLYREGFAAFRMAKAAEFSKVSIGGLTYHFPTKDELVTAVLETISASGLDQVRADALVPFEDHLLLHAIANSAERFFNRPEYLIYLDVYLSVRRDTAVGTIAHDLLTKQRALVQQIWSTESEKRGIDKPTASLIVTTIWSCARGLAISNHNSKTLKDSKKVLAFCVSALQHQLLTQNDG